MEEEVASRWQKPAQGASNLDGAAPLESGEIQGCDGLSREGAAPPACLSEITWTQASGAIHWQGLLVYWAPSLGSTLACACGVDQTSAGGPCPVVLHGL